MLTGHAALALPGCMPSTSYRPHQAVHTCGRSPCVPKKLHLAQSLPGCRPAQRLFHPCPRGGCRGRQGAQAAQALFGGVKGLFGGDEGKAVMKKYQAEVDAINAQEPALVRLSDEQLRARTRELQSRVRDGESLDALLVDAFAVRFRCVCFLVASHMWSVSNTLC